MLKNSVKSYFLKMTIHELYLMNHVEEWDISYNSLLYLDLIQMTPNCTGSSLAEQLGISKAAVTLKLNELMKQGLIVKKQSDKDKRIFYVEVSNECQSDYQKMDERLSRAVKKIECKYSEKELNIFGSILSELCDEYCEVGNEK